MPTQAIIPQISAKQYIDISLELSKTTKDLSFPPISENTFFLRVKEDCVNGRFPVEKVYPAPIFKQDPQNNHLMLFNCHVRPNGFNIIQKTEMLYTLLQFDVNQISFHIIQHQLTGSLFQAPR